MIKEIIDEINENGEVIGQIDKDLAHKEGRLHKSIHLWIINKNNEVLIQYRCGDKKLYPNTWDCSIGGHVGTKENSIDTVFREAKEELGITLDLNFLNYLGKIKENIIYDNINSNEIVDIFIIRQDIKLEDITLQKEEVSNAKYVSIEELFNLIDSNVLLPHEDEYQLLKEYLTKLVLKSNLRSIENYPKEGIDFKDVTTILKDPFAFQQAIDMLAYHLEKENIDKIVGPEARGIMFAAPVAYKLKKGYIPVRKPGKLPCETINQSYALEYGMDTLEIHKDAIKPGDRVAIIDDLMATGGTMEAIVKLIERLGGNVVKILCLIDLPGLGGKERLKDYPYEYILSDQENIHFNKQNFNQKIKKLQ